MTDWSALGSCTQCEAKRGGRCYTLLAAGPSALPSQFADEPHSGRIKATGRATAKRGPAIATARKAPAPARRAVRRTETIATGWAAVAARQQERKRAQ